MEKPIINFDEFDLPFTSVEDENSNQLDYENEEDEELDASEIKENMESKIPKEAIFLGGIDSAVENWTNWSNKDEYYIIPLSNGEYDWALFRISWDDNWESWNWSFDARLLGFKSSYKEAAKYILLNLWDSWQIDLNDKENTSYLNLLKDI
jgi:hypothetical protein